MRITLLLFTIITCISSSSAQSKVNYTLHHNPNSDKISIEIEMDSMNASTIKLVIPRSAPGTYEITDYSAYVDNVKGFSTSGKTLNGELGEGSFFSFNDKIEYLKKVSYEVDIKKMESNLLGGFASSKSRDNYLGILGYSVFGFIEGLESEAINLKIKTGASWPVFSTLKPSVKRQNGFDSYEIENFALLADAQYLLGTSVQVLQVKEAKIPLFIAVYSETPISINEIGRRGLIALNGLSDYFGYIPMPHYTMFYEFLKPFSDRHDYGFYMEHLNSMSASNDLSNPILDNDSKARLGGIVHHMGHSWLPLRSYGEGYRPFEWQVAPVIETIWLNEGFTWYVSYYHVLKNKEILNFFEKTINTAPEYINRKSLRELSVLGSTQYGMDFRIGRNLFSRGALMAYDLDEFIQKQTNGKKSFKEAILGLLKWTEVNQKPFKYEEIEPIMSKSTGIDLSDVWNKWQKPKNK